MSDVSKVTAIAEKEVGYLEKKSDKNLDSKTANAGSNNYTKYGKWFGLNPAYWCAEFICWIFAQALGYDKGKKALWNCYSAACETLRQAAIKEKRYTTSKPKAGYVIFFSGTRHAGANHIGYVYRVVGNVVYTIEGNTSGGSSVIDNGGGVARKSYSIYNPRIMGYGIPNYSDNKEEPNKIKEDGEWGKATTTLAQQVFGTEVDGIVSKQVLKYRSKYLPNCLVSSWKFFETPSKYEGGSQLIKAIQKWVGAKKDGLCGPATIKALQKKLKIKVSGVMDKDTVIAFQKYLNKKVK